MKVNRFAFLMLSILCWVMSITSCSSTGRGGGGGEGPKPPKPLPKAKVNLYVENSGSMDGYVKPNHSVFRLSLHAFLNEIDSDSVNFESLTVGYINDTIPYQKPVTSFLDVQDFTTNLTVLSFHHNVGNRTTTTFSNIFDALLKVTDNKTVNILVSDFVTDEVPAMMESNIKSVFKKHLNSNTDLAVCVYQLYSQFEGKYYYPGASVRSENINAARPFYIWIIGDVRQVEKLRDFKPQQVVNELVMLKGGKTVDYAVIKGSGNFKLHTDKIKTKTHVRDLMKDGRTGKASFAIYANLSEFMLDENYLTNVENYSISPITYKCKVSVPAKMPQGYSHKIDFENEKVVAGVMNVKILMKLPKWVSEKNDDVGTNVHAAMDKTYALENLIQGTYDAFTENQDFYTEIKLYINQQ